MSTKPPHLLSAVNAPNLTRLLVRYGCQPTQLPRVASFYGFSLLSSPFRWLDRLQSSRKVARTVVKNPIFIVGHWRSGTTYLHNLISRDSQFGWVSNFHCAAASSFLGAPGLSRRLMGDRLPNSRPMDSMKLTFDAPQEEELAMARMSPYSFHHCFHFPKQMRYIFDRYVLFSGKSSDQIGWRKHYLKFLRRVTLDWNGQPLCLKNPANTARIPVLLEMFPEARFIHIYRNPFTVYQSTLNLWKQLLPCWSLQSYDPAQVQENVLFFYQQLMGRYFADRDKIPADQLVEVCYEELEVDPLRQLERIYSMLNIERFHEAKAGFEGYLESVGKYQKNTYSHERKDIDLIRSRWEFAIQAWGYDAPIHHFAGQDLS